MKILKTLALLAPFALAGCVAETPPGQSVTLPPEVLALVAPGQDITTARIESDGCYWYLHRGPVETTYIPLETRDDRMICTRPQS